MEEQCFPYWESLDELKESDSLCYHGSTVLPDGRQGLLVDPGAWSNLAGETWVQMLAAKALQAGHNIAQGRLGKPMHVAGVGKDTNKAEWEVHMPIALIDSDGAGALHEFHVPVVGKDGKGLPALLGLQSMSRQSADLKWPQVMNI